MQDDAFGGGFLYHLEDNKVTLGFVLGLDYKNPWLSPFEEMQRWKTHPAIAAHLEGAKRIGYGARAINNGTPQALPKTVFPGGALIGCDAGYLNAARIKGSHAAIKSGMLAADAAFDAVSAGRANDELSAYPAAFEKSWLSKELNQYRNFKLWFKKGMLVGTVMTGIEQWLLPKLGIDTPPWTLHGSKPDHVNLEPAAQHAQIHYPKPDGKLTFDRLTSNNAAQHAVRRCQRSPCVVSQFVHVLQKFSALRQHGCPPVWGFVQRPLEARVSDIYSKEAHGTNYVHFQELACPANYLRSHRYWARALKY